MAGTKRLVPMGVALLLLLGVLPSSGRAVAQEPDPLVQDSVNALAGLVSADHCAQKDAADGDASNGITLLYLLCDDGLPPSGGGSNGIPVPAKYAANEAGDDWSGLPAPASAEEVATADASDDLQPDDDRRITLDVDVSLPPSSASVLYPDLAPVGAPASGNPVIVFMHGCCGGNKASWEASSVDASNESWHHSNAWFAARGYVVINLTARGFRNSNDEGSSGTTQLDSRRYEINDAQYVTGLLADLDAQRAASDLPPLFSINRKKIGSVGGSYGGGFSWLFLTDPTWRSPLSKFKLRLGAAVPKYGWTDLVESLVPSGHYLDRNATGKTVIAPTAVQKAASRNPIGVEKQSIVSALYATGNMVNGNHTTFPAYMHNAFTRLNQGEPYDGDADVEAIVDTFLKDRSAYYQSSYWRRVKAGLRVPLFVAATWTDPLFPTMESLRFYNKLKKVDPRYPVQMNLGDYQHFTANKPKEWDDLCGSDHHVCTFDDYPGAARGNFSKVPTRVRIGINTRINAFLDHYLLGKRPTPPHNVSATTTICAANATDTFKVDEPGIEYDAPTWRALTGGPVQKFAWAGGGAVFGSTTNGGVDNHADESDPVFRQTQSDKCTTTTKSNPGLGVVQLESKKLDQPFTMMGLPLLQLKTNTAATDYWVGARLYDADADGNMTLVTRGVCRVNTAIDENGCSQFDLFGNAWTFPKNHTLVLELSQSDSPFLRRDNVPSTVEYPEVELQVPTTKERFRHDFRD
ncbi:MAG TPA: CocE/NonD family hydrolase [Actinomycetota bacterium]|nr:CocE/NonD family hydrolase [Actinomycetota bacterium]